VIYSSGDKEVYKLLILSQVVLSLQLPFAIIPLIRLTSDRERMGEFANKPWVLGLAGIVAMVIIFLNGWLVKNTFDSLMSIGANVYLIAIPGVALGVLLVYLLVAPVSRMREEAMPVPELAEEDGLLPVYRTILIPLDHSRSDRMALRHAVALAKQSGARVLLLHVEEGVTSQVYGPDSSTAEVTGGSEYLHQISERVSKQQVACELFIRHSNSPAGEIIQFARQEKPDLIVMAAHGHGKLGDLVYGETIEQVRHAVKIPLFVVQ
jgi:manganese transport protein